jgi:type I restriction enzyme R subunit
MNNFLEDNLEKATIELFVELGYTYENGVTIAPNQALSERESYGDVVLKERFLSSLFKINKHLSSATLQEQAPEVLKKVLHYQTSHLVSNNKKFHSYLTDGIDIEYRDAKGNTLGDKVYLFDFNAEDNNDFLIVNQFTIVEKEEKRPDLIIFVNGLPLGVFELKSLSNESVGLEDAYNQLQTYKKTIPSLFFTNELLVISDGVDAKLGTITSSFERFMNWKSVDGELCKSHLQLETLVKGVFTKSHLLQIIKNFILFQTSSSEEDIKIVAAYHQFFAVKKAVDSTVNAILNATKKAGLIWHTQGSGKSLSMLFYTAKLIQEVKNPTVIVLTDRNDLDEQLFSTFSKSHAYLRQTPIQVENREDLRKQLTRAGGGIIFTTIQKFSPNAGKESIELISDRKDIILVVDEAHRSQYGMDAKVNQKSGKLTYGYAKHLRDALPEATFIGFTGTPIEDQDKSTREVFGSEIDIYDMTQAVEDGATLKLYYESRLAKLSLDEEVLKAVDAEYEKIALEGAESELIEKSKRALTKLEDIVGDPQRLEMLANDIVLHFEEREKISSGKAMIVCMSRKVAVKLYDEIVKVRPLWHSEELTKGKIKVIMTNSASDEEILQAHRTSKQERDSLALKMKDTEDELRIVIVVDMWLTGFDVPSMDTMYIDKPMKSHNLMQAIARVNRVFKGKVGGLVVDYIGLMASLKDALNTYTSRDKNQVELNLDLAMDRLKQSLSALQDMFNGLDYELFFRGSDRNRLDLIAEGIEEVLSEEYIQEGAKKSFLKLVAEVSNAQTLCQSLLDEDTKLEIAYFKAVKSALVKIEGREFSIRSINKRVASLISGSFQKESMLELNDILGIKQDELDLFNEDFLNEIASMKRKNIALEILKRLLGDKIKGLERTNLVKSEKFSKLMQELLNKYNNKALTNAEVLDELLELSKSMATAFKESNDLGLNDEEIAFYDALTRFDSVKEAMDDELLKELSQKLADEIRQSKTVDWQYKDNARAKMRSVIKRLLKKYKYPPTEAAEALEYVLKQVQLTCEEASNI